MGTALAVGIALALLVITGALAGSQTWSGDLTALVFPGALTTHTFLARFTTASIVAPMHRVITLSALAASLSVSSSNRT